MYSDQVTIAGPLTQCSYVPLDSLCNTLLITLKAGSTRTYSDIAIPFGAVGQNFYWMGVPFNIYEENVNTYGLWFFIQEHRPTFPIRTSVSRFDPSLYSISSQFDQFKANFAEYGASTWNFVLETPSAKIVIQIQQLVDVKPPIKGSDIRDILLQEVVDDIDMVEEIDVKRDKKLGYTDFQSYMQVDDNIKSILQEKVTQIDTTTNRDIQVFDKWQMFYPESETTMNPYFDPKKQVKKTPNVWDKTGSLPNADDQRVVSTKTHAEFEEDKRLAIKKEQRGQYKPQQEEMYKLVSTHEGIDKFIKNADVKIVDGQIVSNSKVADQFIKEALNMASEGSLRDFTNTIAVQNKVFNEMMQDFTTADQGTFSDYMVANSVDMSAFVASLTALLSNIYFNRNFKFEIMIGDGDDAKMANWVMTTGPAAYALSVLLGSSTMAFLGKLIQKYRNPDHSLVTLEAQSQLQASAMKNLLISFFNPKTPEQLLIQTSIKDYLFHEKYYTFHNFLESRGIGKLTTLIQSFNQMDIISQRIADDQYHELELITNDAGVTFYQRKPMTDQEIIQQSYLEQLYIDKVSFPKYPFQGYGIIPDQKTEYPDEDYYDYPYTFKFPKQTILDPQLEIIYDHTKIGQKHYTEVFIETVQTLFEQTTSIIADGLYEEPNTYESVFKKRGQESVVETLTDPLKPVNYIFKWFTSFGEDFNLNSDDITTTVESLKTQQAKIQENYKNETITEETYIFQNVMVTNLLRMTQKVAGVALEIEKQHLRNLYETAKIVGTLAIGGYQALRLTGIIVFAVLEFIQQTDKVCNDIREFTKRKVGNAGRRINRFGNYVADSGKSIGKSITSTVTETYDTVLDFADVQKTRGTESLKIIATELKRTMLGIVNQAVEVSDKFDKETTKVLHHIQDEVIKLPNTYTDFFYILKQYNEADKYVEDGINDTRLQYAAYNLAQQTKESDLSKRYLLDSYIPVSQYFTLSQPPTTTTTTTEVQIKYPSVLEVPQVIMLNIPLSVHYTSAIERAEIEQSPQPLSSIKNVPQEPFLANTWYFMSEMYKAISLISSGYRGPEIQKSLQSGTKLLQTINYLQVPQLQVLSPYEPVEVESKAPSIDIFPNTYFKPIKLKQKQHNPLMLPPGKVPLPSQGKVTSLLGRSRPNPNRRPNNSANNPANPANPPNNPPQQQGRANLPIIPLAGRGNNQIAPPGGAGPGGNPPGGNPPRGNPPPHNNLPRPQQHPQPPPNMAPGPPPNFPLVPVSVMSFFATVPLEKIIKMVKLLNKVLELTKTLYNFDDGSEEGILKMLCGVNNQVIEITQELSQMFPQYAMYFNVLGSQFNWCDPNNIIVDTTYMKEIFKLTGAIMPKTTKQLEDLIENKLFKQGGAYQRRDNAMKERKRDLKFKKKRKKDEE